MRRVREADVAPGHLLFPDLAEPAPQQLLDGSARLALRVQPRFDRYIFIERDAERCRELEALKTEFTELAPSISVEQGDANDVIQAICAKRWGGHRAVLFLEERVVKATNETIGRYFNDRLKLVFAGVAEPGVLRNSANCPLYLLFFAAGNPKGAPTALNIANHLLKGMR